jgi:proteasome accessory factor A
LTPLFGTETEYGISVEGKGAGDLMAESRALVNAYSGRFASPWYYRGEDARNDMRGFHADRLSYDPEDAKFDDPGAPPLPAEQERADHVLVNGARLYNDHGHPEYSTPECSTLLDLVAHDRAGERIVLACAKSRTESGAGRVRIYKNNTDYHGSSYGTHENYLMSRGRPFGEVLANFLPFFVTRIVFAGAGKVSSDSVHVDAPFQLSQRADFFTEEASVDTLHRRPIFNTRDEPHADPRLWRRLHVICGDANLSEFATAIKIGTTALVARLTEQGWSADIGLKSPVAAMQSISRDQSYRWIVETDALKTIGAVDLQRIYLTAAKERFAGEGGDVDWTLSAWETTLDALARDPMELADRLDWVARRSLLDEFREAESLRWDDDLLLSLDLEYANVDPDDGLRFALEAGGHLMRLTTDEDVDRAMRAAPSDTRAAIRGAFVEKFAENIGVAGWNCVVLRNEGESWLAELDNYLSPAVVAPALAEIRDADGIESLLRHFRKQGK